MKIRNVLSLFDGMSCGQLALNQSKIKYGKYYASEIDQDAINVALKNFPKTIQVGSVTDIDPKDFTDVDLIMFGSPCTDLSQSGRRRGMSTSEGEKITNLEQYLKLKEKGIEFVGQSFLFWEAIRLLKAIKPKYFLMENTLMGEEWKTIVTETLGVEPVRINSSLVSTQNRERLYWSNLPNLTVPKDLHLNLESIIPNAVAAGYRGRKLKGDSHYTRFFTVRGDGKSNCLVTNPYSTNLVVQNGERRFITPEEAELIQTLPKGYTKLKKISNGARYKMIGNGWTINVINHIFKSAKKYEKKVN